MKRANSLEPVAHDLRMALVLAVFVEFSFAAALLATLGAFNGGLPTSTPIGAQAYLVVGLIVTVGVIVRIWQMVRVAERGDRAALAGMHLAALSIVALVFSAILPCVYLNAAAAAMPRE